MSAYAHQPHTRREITSLFFVRRGRARRPVPRLLQLSLWLIRPDVCKRFRAVLIFQNMLLGILILSSSQKLFFPPVDALILTPSSSHAANVVILLVGLLFNDSFWSNAIILQSAALTLSLILDKCWFSLIVMKCSVGFWAALTATIMLVDKTTWLTYYAPLVLAVYMIWGTLILMVIQRNHERA
jgi:hypothetical protein